MAPVGADRRVGAIAVALVAAAALVPVLAAGVPANQIPVAELPGEGDALEQPGGAAWGEVEPVTIQLSSAPSGVPDAGDTAVGAVRVRAAHTDRRLYVRLAWADATANDTIAGPRSFADAAAVQLPANASGTQPAIAMGSPRNPVNVWYWSGASGTEELLAGGPGSTTAYREPAVEGAVSRGDDEWRLVFHREVAPGDGDTRAAIRTNRDLAVAFAVWNGANDERSGRKAVSEWYTLAMAPPPAGAPYQAILWTIAGIAIVVVILVTAVAVRRRGGEAGAG